jgi:uncharacterized protein YyaL (SSP411 family)
MRTLVLILVLLSSIHGCHNAGSDSENMNEEHRYTNQLINESSPYLLQHAHNPVNWYPWGDEALEKAKKENKLILVSIGYSACHWCHVMERESFEDTTVARIMNENFVCIKVDREERPDIDDIYMTAVQLMTGSGGWPLNCFALPDGRPIYGGTYFPKDKWIQVLEGLTKDYSRNREKWLEAADQLTDGIRKSDLLPLNNAPAQFHLDTLEKMVTNWKPQFDSKEGGPSRAPKFPIPNNYLFLMQYGYLHQDEEVLNHVKLTLDKMAMGGIYDQIGGGFARYSTDIEWKVPHFEKMLYDNAQLLSLYAQGYQLFQDVEYKKVVYQTVDFLERELLDKSGAFYSALDADSEGEEGKFYVWTESEIDSILNKEESKIAKTYYEIGKKGFWEHGNNILLRKKSDTEYAEKLGLSKLELKDKISEINQKLFEARSSRIRPGLDDKTLTSWNALTISGLVDAYWAFGEKRFLTLAKKNAEFIQQNQFKDGKLLHTYKNGVSKQDGFLEDYSFVIEAWLKLYQATFNPRWLEEAQDLANVCVSDFYNSEQGMFYFTSNAASEKLVARKMELNDNVIPASNSSLANSLYLLGSYFDNKAYTGMAKTMLNNIQPQMTRYGSGYSNWGLLYLKETYPFYELAIVGNDLETKAAQMGKEYIPNKMFIGSKKDSPLPLLEGKYVEGETYIYVCVNKACQIPVQETSKALSQINPELPLP